MWTLAAALLALAGPEASLRRLGDESVEVREEASADLTRRGEPVRRLLEVALAAAGDPEVRARLGCLLARLDADRRRREFGGGPRAAGLAAALRTDRFFGPGPVRLTVEIMNVGDAPRLLAPICEWDVEFPREEVRTSASQARVSVRSVAGPAGLRRVAWRAAAPAAPEILLLAPGESASFEYVLDARALPAGDYLLGVEVPADGLRTNPARLMIRK